MAKVFPQMLTLFLFDWLQIKGRRRRSRRTGRKRRRRTEEERDWAEELEAGITRGKKNDFEGLFVFAKSGTFVVLYYFPPHSVATRNMLVNWDNWLSSSIHFQGEMGG